MFKPEGEHKELDKATYEKLIYYLYYLLFYNQWQDENVQETEVQRLKECREGLISIGIFFDDREVQFPALPDLEDKNDRVFRNADIPFYSYNRSNWNDDK